MTFNSSSATNLINLLIFYQDSERVCLTVNSAICALRFAVVLPLCIFVLYLGYRRWRRQRSLKTTSHSDIFTFHVAAMELTWVLGSFFFFFGSYASLKVVETVGIYLTSIVFHGEAFFHMLTCVERYLAVVHPVAYRGLKNERGVRIRNIVVGCVWLLSFGLLGVTSLSLPDLPLASFLSLSLTALIVVTICNLSVLYVLIRPKPGGGGREGVMVEQSKLKAFYTISIIMGVLCLWFLGFLVSAVVGKSALSRGVRCLVMSGLTFLNLPPTLVFPLLFLHRAGKLPCCH